MNLAEPQVFLRALKGAPLACLVALRILRRPAGVVEIACLTGYYRAVISTALRALEGFGLAENPGGYGHWRLSNAAGQLPLFLPGQLSTGPVDNCPELGAKITQFAGGSGSLINSINSSIEELKQLPPPPQLGAKITQFDPPPAPGDPETARIAEILVARAGCSRVRARQVVGAARAAGRDPAWLELDVLHWLAYCKQKGTHIHNPGAFIAKKLANAEPCPPVELAAWSADDLRAQALRRHLDALDAVAEVDAEAEMTGEVQP